MSTTITTEHFRKVEADTTGLVVTCTESGEKLTAALSPDERRTLAVALTADQGGQWTRDDLPDALDVWESSNAREADTRIVLDAVVDHLNAHHPKPDDSMVPARPVSPEERGELWARIRDELRGVYSSTTDQDHRKLDLAASASADTAVEYLNDRGGLGIDTREPLGRALRERDAAVTRAEAHAKGATRANLDRDKAYEELTAMTNRAEQAERDRDYARARLREVCSTPAVSRADIEKAILPHILYPANGTQDLIDDVHALVSGDDPAVYVVRESDIAAVEVHLDEHDHWIAGGRGTAMKRHSAEQVREDVAASLRCVIESEAVARAIEAEQAEDPVEAKVTTRHPENYRLVNEADGSEWRMTRDGSWVAADVLGQEASSDE